MGIQTYVLATRAVFTTIPMLNTWSQRRAKPTFNDFLLELHLSFHIFQQLSGGHYIFAQMQAVTELLRSPFQQAFLTRIFTGGALFSSALDFTSIRTAKWTTCTELDQGRETQFFTSTDCEMIPAFKYALRMKAGLSSQFLNSQRFLTSQFSFVISLRTFHFPPQPS